MASHDSGSECERAWLAAHDASLPRVVAYLRTVTRDTGDLQELIAETVARAWLAREAVLAAPVPPDAMIAYARAAARDFVRSRRRECSCLCRATVEPGAEAPRAMSVGDAILLFNHVNGLLSRLSSHQRIAVDLRWRWGWPYSAIAWALGTTEATARVHALRGMQRMRRLDAATAFPPLAAADVNEN
jgi:DNA-directed RNA polymerase specialized sigma24 family protein